MDLQQTALFKFLKKKQPKGMSPDFVDQAKCLERDARQLLDGVSNTFQHYPSHGFEHSLAIIEQISNILFDDKGQSFAKDLNYLEAFLLIAAAFTHDLGMRISDDEKRSIMKQASWHKFVADNQSVKEEVDDLQNRIEAIRNTDGPIDYINLHLASRDLDFIIADYFRRGHAIRSGEKLWFAPELFKECVLLSQNEDIRDAVCLIGQGHGVSYDRLENDHHYNEEKRIRNETVNLRFLAILLRFGDLCHMDKQRIHPIMRALSDIPVSSVPHWDQYKDIRSKSFNNKELRLTAYLDDPDSYRELRNWCLWMEEESRLATQVMSNAQRHRDWQPPRAKVAATEAKDGQENGATIYLHASDDADFIPHDWKFHLNEKLVMERLIYDVYDNNLDFLRELIQNGLDANRVKMVMELEEKDKDVPDWLPDVAEHIRNEFPLTIRVTNEIIQGQEKQVIYVEDCGTGMDEDIIKNYFLQIGQSFYKSDKFAAQLETNPRGKFTSRFGVGFLSVFAVSETVMVETYRGSGKGTPLCLTLEKPDDYLLVQQGKELRRSGTKIKLVMKKPFDEDDIREYLEELIGPVEFPVNLNLYDQELELTDPWPKGQVLYGSKEEQYSFKSWAAASEDCRGEIGCWGVVGNHGDEWALHYTDNFSSPVRERYGMREIIRTYLFGVLTSANISYGGDYWFSFDYRPKDGLTMHRNNEGLPAGFMKSLYSLKNQIVDDNEITFSKRYNDWEKSQLIANLLGFDDEQIEKYVLLPIYRKGHIEHLRFEDLRQLPDGFWTCEFTYSKDFDLTELENSRRKSEVEKVLRETIEGPVYFSDDNRLDIHRREQEKIWASFLPVEQERGLHCKLTKWRKREAHGLFSQFNEFAFTNEFSLYVFSSEVINTYHPVGKWLQDLMGRNDLPYEIKKQRNRVFGFKSSLFGVKRWNENADIPDEYKFLDPIDEKFKQFPD